MHGTERAGVPPLIALVIVDFNGRDDTLKCLRSLEEADLERCLTFVIDNGSRPSNAEAIAAAHPWAHVIRRETNGGWAGGNNEGIKAGLARGVEWLLLLNNDTTVSPDLVPRLLAAARAHPSHGILGPVIHFMDEPEKVMTDGVAFNTGRGGDGAFFDRRAVPPQRTDPPTVVDVDIVNGCCMMVSAEVFRRVGLVDERFFLVHEESDLCLRAKRAGLRCGVVAESLILHKGSSSFQRAGKRFQRYFDARNLALLLRKHLGTLREGRGALRSRLEYLKYAYYRFSHEVEAGKPEAAQAVVEGLLDALAGRYGPYESRPRTGAALLTRALETVRRWQARR